VSSWAAPSEPDPVLFRELVRQWKEDTISLSSTEDMALHPAYQRIIGMGPAALPWILEELQTEPDYWFWALRAITGQDPVCPAERGQMAQMTRSWLDWGRQHRLCR
jgi:hypothetical protein